ncbi:hypothetical protein TWF706_010153 [Orbilia oligospora]|nr:hypothetical protein TWF706_010153 [Orbilia oligospora]
MFILFLAKHASRTSIDTSSPISRDLLTLQALRRYHERDAHLIIDANLPVHSHWQFIQKLGFCNLFERGLRKFYPRSQPKLCPIWGTRPISLQSFDTIGSHPRGLLCHAADPTISEGAPRMLSRRAACRDPFYSEYIDISQFCCFPYISCNRSSRLASERMPSPLLSRRARDCTRAPCLFQL